MTTVPGQVNCDPRWTNRNDSAVSVAWQPPSRENGVTLSYHIRLVGYSSRDSVLAEVNVSSEVRDVTLFPQQMLVGGVPYIVEVVAENSIGRSTEVCQAIDFFTQLRECSELSYNALFPGLFCNVLFLKIAELFTAILYKILFE